MATPKLENYLRTYRKRSGLSQREVAFLVGCRNGAQVSRYEKRRRLPPLRTALACEAAFGVPVSVLFAGLREAVREFEAALRLDPRQAPAWLFLGTVHLDLGEPAKAIEPVERALKIQPDNLDAQEAMAEVSSRSAGSSSLRSASGNS